MIFTKAILIIVVTVNRNINQSKSKYITQIITQVISKSLHYGHCTSGNIHTLKLIRYYGTSQSSIISSHYTENATVSFFVLIDINSWPHFLFKNTIEFYHLPNDGIVRNVHFFIITVCISYSLVCLF